jgi:LacI family transcriptional regulator
MGGCIALQEAGLSIPEDISVMGYDGIYLSRVMKPQLVTWQQNTRMLGRMAADKLVQMIEHPRVTLAEQIPVTGKLLEGGAQHRMNGLDLVPGELEP